jgi:HSP90 family molecular chaperone
MGYISDSKSYREYMMMVEREREILREKNRMQHTKDNITNQVIEDLKSRAERGYKKYNTTLGENNHQNMIQHAYEEALDLSQYLKKEITTLNTVQDLVNQFPNDSELGEEIRKRYAQTKTD